MCDVSAMSENSYLEDVNSRQHGRAFGDVYFLGSFLKSQHVACANFICSVIRISMFKYALVYYILVFID